METNWRSGLKAIVEQDGADFYIFRNADEPTAHVNDHCALQHEVVSCPAGIENDSDMEGAAAARRWFVHKYCPSHFIQPVFEG
jgi:hypothetical protein